MKWQVTNEWSPAPSAKPVLHEECEFDYHGVPVAMIIGGSSDAAVPYLWEVYLCPVGEPPPIARIELSDEAQVIPLRALTRDEAIREALAALRAWYVENVGPLGERAPGRGRPI